MIKNIIITSLLGLFGGFLSGFTGLATTGIILVGLSISHVITDYKTLLGTLLYVIAFPLSIGSLWEFYKQKKINFLLGNIIVVTMIIGSFMGTKVILSKNYNISTKFIKYLSGIISVIIGIYFLIDAYNLK
jgi:uncharacterized membrane protein YfcA